MTHRQRIRRGRRIRRAERPGERVRRELRAAQVASPAYQARMARAREPVHAITQTRYGSPRGA